MAGVARIVGATGAMSAVFAGLAALICAGPACALGANDIASYRGPDREQKLIEGAAKEGQVVLYSAMIVNQMLRPLAAAFAKKYPFVKMTYLRADSEELLPRISAEARAGNVVGDLFEGSGGGEVAVAAGLTQPFYSPVLAEYPDVYRDPNANLAPTRLSYFGIAYNTKQVSAERVPKTYEDLLDPQWKGRMAWPYATTGRYLFLINLRLAWGEDKAMAYFKKLAEQKIINFASGSARTLVDRVIAGEYPIALNIYAHHPLISAAKGAPVNARLLNPVPSAAGTISVIKDAPHPHAAMLLLDFILSRAGQKILSDAEYFPANPAVPALPQLAGIVPKTVGFAENYIPPQQLNSYIDSTDQILQSLFR
jgi:iron(III) transport system substrate-binding protein